MRLRLTKHHGLANDFLVLLDADGTRPVDAELARRVCDRRRGVGADGLIRATRDPSTGRVRMELRNADGSRAEMSGNGIRCLAQALVDHGWVPEGEFSVDTAAGERRLTARGEVAPGERWVSVDMGAAAVLDGDPEACNVGNGRMRVSMGNPHLVLLGPDPRTVDVERLGPELEHAVPGRQNVEFVALGPGPDEITMRVWERGVGETQACGTGACAAAFAVHRWGKAGPKVTVHQPGGAAEVDLSGPTVVLTGPSVLVATVELPA